MTSNHSATYEEAASERSSAWLPVWLGCYILLSLLSLSLIWLFPFVPTLDGPAHLDAAATLLELAQGNPFLSTFFAAQWRLATNQLYHGLLVLLGSALPLLVAEKLLLSLYALALPASTLFALRGLGAKRLAVFLVFPAIYPFVFYLGFYNFCFGLIFFLLALGVYFRLQKATTLSQRVLLGLALALCLALCYFAHIIAAANALLALGVMVAVALLKSRANAPLTALLVAAAALPTLFFILRFFVRQPVGAVDGATRFLSVPRLFASFFLHLPELSYKVYSPLVTHSWLDVLFTGPWHLLLLALAALALFKSVRGRTLPQLELFAALVVLLIIILWTPNRLGEIGFLTDRFLPYGYALLILWLGTVPFSSRVWRVAALVGVVCGGALFIYRLPIHAQLNASLEEFAAARAVIADNSTVLPLILNRGGNEVMPTGWPYANLRYNPMLHAVGYIALGRSIATLNDYQAAKGYFPLRYRDRTDPITFLSLGGLGEIEQPPFAFNLQAYKERTGEAVDYVLLWGDLATLRDRPNVQAILAQLESYTLVYTSSPSNFMHVYARQPLAALGEQP